MYTSDRKILQVYMNLKDSGVIRFDTEFYNPIGMSKQMFTNIKNQNKYPERQSWHFTPEHIEKICLVFNINANFIFGLSDVMYNKQKIKGNINGNIKKETLN